MNPIGLSLTNEKKGDLPQSNLSLHTAAPPPPPPLSSSLRTKDRSNNHVVSDRYRSLSRQDIDDLIQSLRTLASCIETPRSSKRSSSFSQRHRSSSKTIYQSNRYDRQSTEKLRLNQTDQNQRQASIKAEEVLSSIPLSSFLLDKIIYVDRNESSSVGQIRILPQQAQTLEILQTEPISIDSLNLKEKFSSQIDVATQWSLETEAPPTEDILTKTEREEFLSKFDLPMCRCAEAKRSPIDDHPITCLSLESEKIRRRTKKRRTRRTTTKNRKNVVQRRNRKESSSSSFDLFDMDTTLFDDTITVSDP